jgi:hypothetical protein
MVAVFIVALIVIRPQLTCEAVPICEQGKVTVSVPLSYPRNYCGLICGTPEEKIWWDSYIHIEKWNSWLILLTYVASAYITILLVEFSGKWLYSRLLNRIPRHES